MLTLIVLLLAALGALIIVPNVALPNTNPTIADWAAEVGPDGEAAKLVHLLSQTNDVLLDETYVEANGKTFHQVAVSTELPTVYFTSINAFIPSSKATSSTVNEPLSLMESRSVIAKKLVEMNPGQQFRMNQAIRHLEGHNQKKAQKMFYGNHSVDDKECTGLSARYSSLSAGNAQNILDAGGSGSDLMSVWLLGWSPETVYCTFPEGSAVGLQRNDKGLQQITKTETDGSQSYQDAYCEVYNWDWGLSVADWRYAVRIANIDVSDLLGLTGTQELTDYATNLIYLMIRAIDRIPNLNLCRPVFYMNRTARSALAIHALNKTSSVLDIEKGVNQFKMNFLGIKCALVDQLVMTEDRVV